MTSYNEMHAIAELVEAGHTMAAYTRDDREWQAALTALAKALGVEGE